MPLSTAIVRVLDDVYKDKASTAYMAGLNLVLGEAQKRNPTITKKHVEQPRLLPHRKTGGEPHGPPASYGFGGSAAGA
jgi:hypothetical protein